MWESSGRLVIIFNGEIYNYRELRKELVADGYAFGSHSDTDSFPRPTLLLNYLHLSATTPIPVHS